MTGMSRSDLEATAMARRVMGRSMRLISGFGERASLLLSPKVVIPYLAAAILSLVSFHTTYYGMRSFYGLEKTGEVRAPRQGDPIANAVSGLFDVEIESIFAVAFAAVVQGGILFASAYLSWLLLNAPPRELRRRTEHDMRWVRHFIVAILALLLPISIVFSYGARLEWQMGSEQKAVVQAGGAHSDAISLLNRLKGLMGEREQALSAGIVASPEFRDWAHGMDKLARTAAHAAEPIRFYLQSVAKAEAEKRDAERRLQTAASQQTLDQEREGERVRNALAALDDEISQLAARASAPPPSTTRIDERIAALEEEMRKEQSGTGRCGSAGEGRCFAYYKAERDKAQREKEALLGRFRDEIRKYADDLTTLKKARIEKSAELERILDQTTAIGLAGASGVPGERAATVDVPRRIRELQPRLGDQSVALRRALDELGAHFTTETYTKAIEACRNLQPLSLIQDLSADLGRVVCEPGALAPAVAEVNDFNDRKARFARACSAIAPFAGGGGGGGAGTYTSHLFDEVNTCIELADLGRHETLRPSVAALSQSLAETMASRNAGVDYLTFTLGELRDGKRVAVLALVFAITIDALVLVFTFLGEIPRMRSRSGAATLAPAEREDLFRQLQRINDVLDTSSPASYKTARSMLACLGVAGDDAVTSIDLEKIANKTERLDVARRLVPLVTSGLAWKLPKQENAVCLSERALALLAADLARLIEHERGIADARSDERLNGQSQRLGYDKRPARQLAEGRSWHSDVPV